MDHRGARRPSPPAGEKVGRSWREPGGRAGFGEQQECGWLTRCSSNDPGNQGSSWLLPGGKWRWGMGGELNSGRGARSEPLLFSWPRRF